MLDILKFADARLREPSTWAGLAALLGMLHITVDPGLWQTVTLWGTVGASGLAMVLSEAGSKPAAQIAGDVLATLAVALKQAAPAQPATAPAVAPAKGDAVSEPVKPAVSGSAAGAALVLLFAGIVGLSACAPGSGAGAGSAPDQKQVLYAVESAYALVANDEAAALRTGAVPAAAADAMRATDTTLYATLVAWRADVEAGTPPAAGAVAAIQTGMQGLVDQLSAAKALSPPAQLAADAALSLTAALIAGG